MLEAPVLRRVHLVLPDARDDDRVVVGQGAETLDAVLRLERPVRLLVVAVREPPLPIGELPEPCGTVRHAAGFVLTSVQLGGELRDHVLAVADDRHVGRAVLPDLGGIDVDVDHLGLRRERRQLPRHPVVEAGPERHEHVRLLDRGDGRVVAVHPRHPQAELVRVGERSTRHQGGDDREPAEGRELRELGVRIGLDHPAADVEHGPLRGHDQLDRLHDLALVALRRGLVPRQVDALGPTPGRLRKEHVLREVDQDGARAAGRGDVERLAHGLGDERGVLHQEVVLRDGHRDAGDVGLLEGVIAHHGGRHLPGDRDERDRVHLRVGDRRHEVGPAGT